MKLGAENKKSLYALVGLGIVAAYMVYSQFFAGPSYPTPSRSAARSSEVPPGTPAPDIAQSKSKAGQKKVRSSNGDFHPVYIAKKPEDRPNPETIDPTIRFDLLARVMKVPPAGGDRDLFQISKTPPVKNEVAELNPKDEPKVYRFVGPRAPPPPPSKDTGKKTMAEVPPTPPPFKYFGYSALHPDGRRTAYFISTEGDDLNRDIYKADEGDIVKKRWKVVQIGLDKVLVEDMQDKRSQPLKIEPEESK